MNHIIEKITTKSPNDQLGFTKWQHWISYRMTVNPPSLTTFLVVKKMVVFQVVSDMFNNYSLHVLTKDKGKVNWAIVTRRTRPWLENIGATTDHFQEVVRVPDLKDLVKISTNGYGRKVAHGSWGCAPSPPGALKQLIWRKRRARYHRHRSELLSTIHAIS